VSRALVQVPAQSATAVDDWRLATGDAGSAAENQMHTQRQQRLQCAFHRSFS
jgi:hypothetical protein